jgi:fructan beta-fructosidase
MLTAAPEDRCRPLVHFTPPEGWMNDPNGLIYADGEYHLFYQHRWPRHWGHAVSADLVDWTHLPIALMPDDLGDIWSGCVVLDTNDTSGFFGGGSGMVAVFTHQKEGAQRQSLAYSADAGRTWTKYAGNPVLTGETKDFRDPKVFWYSLGGHWSLVLTAGDRLRFYASPNLRDWTPTGEFAPLLPRDGAVWECPDLYPIPMDGDSSRTRWILQASWLEMSLFSGGPERPGTAGIHYFVGDFDGQTFTGDADCPTGMPLSAGRDDYAAISWENAPDGRRLLLGWMNFWGYASKTPTGPWQGAMTLPREAILAATLSGSCLLQQPLSELDQYFGHPTAYPEHVLTTEAWHVPLDAAASVIRATFILDATAEVRLDFWSGDATGESSPLDCTVTAREISVGRRLPQSSELPSRFEERQSAAFSAPTETVSLLLVLDRCSIEIFTDGGTVYLPALFFPDEPPETLHFSAHGGMARLRELSVAPYHPISWRDKTSFKRDSE